MEENIVSSVNAEPVVNVEPRENIQPSIETTETSEKTVEVAEQPKNEVVQSPEENAKYAQVRREVEAKAKAEMEKAVQRERQAARDAYIAEQGYEWNGKPITTEAEYKQALLEKELYEKYQAQGLPEEVINELVESKKFREQALAEKQTMAQQQKQQAEYKEFLDYFKAENGRDFNMESDSIPQEVWEMTSKGKTLADAYAYHANAQLKAKIAEYEAKLNAQKTNTQNAASSTGSVTGNGNVGADNISFETYEANKHDQNWVMKNFNKIMESRAKW